MLLLNATGAEAEIPIRLFSDSTGAPITGRVWVAGDVKLYLPDGVAWVDATVANIVEKGRGFYALRLAAAETDVPGAVYLDLDTTAVAGASAYGIRDDIVDPVDFADALLSRVIEAGAAATVRTVKQRLNVMFAVLAGKAPSDLNASPYYFRNNPGGSDTKDRAAFTMVAGVRTPTTLDGDE